MNIYRLSQDANDDWDTFDSMVVVAKDRLQAKKMHPSRDENWWVGESEIGNVWAENLGQVDCEYIGQASITYKKPEIILSSFNAG